MTLRTNTANRRTTATTACNALITATRGNRSIAVTAHNLAPSTDRERTN